MDLISTIQDSKQLEEILMDKLRSGKSSDLVLCVNRYAVFFIEELKHFLRIHGFLKSDNPGFNPNSSEQQPLINPNLSG